MEPVSFNQARTRREFTIQNSYPKEQMNLLIDRAFPSLNTRTALTKTGTLQEARKLARILIEKTKCET